MKKGLKNFLYFLGIKREQHAKVTHQENPKISLEEQIRQKVKENKSFKIVDHLGNVIYSYPEDRKHKS